MSLHYLLDGYNIIHQSRSLNRGTLEEQRLSLIQWVKVHRPQGSANNSVTIVFDGQQDGGGYPPQEDGIKIIFSRGQSADDLIKKIIELAENKKKWVVVSDDKDIKLYVRALGAQTKAVKEFEGKNKVGAKIGKHQNVEVQSSKYITLEKQMRINKELEQLWLHKPKPKP